MLLHRTKINELHCSRGVKKDCTCISYSIAFYDVGRRCITHNISAYGINSLASQHRGKSQFSSCTTFKSKASIYKYFIKSHLYHLMVHNNDTNNTSQHIYKEAQSGAVHIYSTTVDFPNEISTLQHSTSLVDCLVTVRGLFRFQKECCCCNNNHTYDNNCSDSSN